MPCDRQWTFSQCARHKQSMNKRFEPSIVLLPFNFLRARKCMLYQHTFRFSAATICIIIVIVSTCTSIISHRRLLPKSMQSVNCAQSIILPNRDSRQRASSGAKKDISSINISTFLQFVFDDRRLHSSLGKLENCFHFQ